MEDVGGVRWSDGAGILVNLHVNPTQNQYTKTVTDTYIAFHCIVLYLHSDVMRPIAFVFTVLHFAAFNIRPTVLRCWTLCCSLHDIAMLSYILHSSELFSFVVY